MPHIGTTAQKVGTTSKYHNVSWSPNHGKWVASIRVNNQNRFSKKFLDEDLAAQHVNWIIDELGLTDRARNKII